MNSAPRVIYNPRRRPRSLSLPLPAQKIKHRNVCTLSSPTKGETPARRVPWPLPKKGKRDAYYYIHLALSCAAEDEDEATSRAEVSLARSKQVYIYTRVYTYTQPLSYGVTKKGERPLSQHSRALVGPNLLLLLLLPIATIHALDSF